MIDNELKVRWANREDLNKLNDFHNKYYASKRTLTQCIWNFSSSDLKNNKLLVAIAEINDEIVGSQALIPISFNNSGKRIMTAKSEETLVARKAFKRKNSS